MKIAPVKYKPANLASSFRKEIAYENCIAHVLRNVPSSAVWFGNWDIGSVRYFYSKNGQK